MTPVTIVFDEITNVRRVRSTKFAPAHTVFSFVSQSKLTGDVTVPGHPRLDSGMRVRPLLRRAGDWHTLVGWVDVDTGSVVGPKPGERLLNLAVLIGLLLVIYVAWFYSGLPVALVQPSQWMLAGILVLVWLAILGAEVRDYLRDRADLSAIAELARMGQDTGF